MTKGEQAAIDAVWSNGPHFSGLPRAFAAAFHQLVREHTPEGPFHSLDVHAQMMAPSNERSNLERAIDSAKADLDIQTGAWW